MRQLRRYGLFTLLLVLVLTCTFALLACSGDDADKGEDGSEVLQIRIENMPESIVYSGDLIDLEDAKILATTRAGAVISVPVTQEMLSGFNTNKLGEQTVTINYESCTTTFVVNVLKAEVQAISIADRPTVISVVQGGELSLKGVKLKVELQSRSIIIDNITNAMIRGYDKSLPVGVHTIYVVYDGFSAPLEIEVLSKSVISLQIVSKPKDMQYFVGERLNASGLEILRKYDNGTQDTIKYDDDATKFTLEYDFSRESARSLVKVTVDGLFVTFNDCVVRHPIVTSFSVDVEPTTKAISLNGEELSSSGKIDALVEGGQIAWKEGAGTVVYDNGETKNVSLSDPSIYIFYDSKTGPKVDMNTCYTEPGAHVLYVRYGNSDSYAPVYITVKEKNPYRLLLGDTRPEGERIEDKVFIEGSRFSTTFLRYNILYNNATYEYPVDDVNSWGSLQENMLADDGSTFNLSVNNLENGKQIVNFTISGVSAGYKISVIEKKATNITIKEPYRNMYVTGSTLDYTGSYLYVQYNDKTFERMEPIPENAVTLFNEEGSVVKTMSYVGTYTAKVIFDGLEKEFEVEAVESDQMASLIVLAEKKEEILPDSSVQETYESMPLSETYEYASFEAIPFDKIFMYVTIGSATKQVALSNAEILECDRYASGTQEILFRYTGYLFKLNVNIIGRKITSIEVKKAPSKVVYILGEDTELDVSGLLVTKVFNDGDRGEQSYFDKLWSFDYDLTKTGTQTVVVNYDLGDRVHKTSFEIEVVESAVVGISFDAGQEGMTSFNVEVFNQERNEYERVEIFNGIMVTYRDDVNLTFIYNGDVRTLYFNVEYANGTVVRKELKASYLSYDKNVNPGEDQLEKDKIITIGEKANKKVVDGYKISTRINYSGFTANVNLCVVYRELESIEIYEMPDVVTYAEGQALNRNGGYIRRTFSDGETDILPMTNGLIGLEGYEVYPFKNVQGGTYLDQVITLSYGGKKAEFTVRTYRKLVAEPTIGNSIFSYGDGSEPVVTIRESIVGFDIPNTSLEYYVDDVWTATRPVYPGTYPLRIMVESNEYYESSVVGDESGVLNLIIKKKAIIVKIDAMSKTYKEKDPEFVYAIEDGELVGNDYVEIEITREEGEDVKYVGIGANRVIGSYAIVAKLTNNENTDNALYELVYEQVGLTIYPKTATTSANGSVINVEFIPPIGYNGTTNTIDYTGSSINAFTAKYTDQNGFTIIIDEKDILYYDEEGNLLTERPKEVGTYVVKISDNYSFQGISAKVFAIK